MANENTYYILDLGIYSKADLNAEVTYEYLAEARAASSPRKAAEDWAAGLDDQHDGMKCECLVADNPEGEDAEEYVVNIRVEWSYDAAKVVPRGK